MKVLTDKDEWYCDVCDDSIKVTITIDEESDGYFTITCKRCGSLLQIGWKED